MSVKSRGWGGGDTATKNVVSRKWALFLCLGSFCAGMFFTSRYFPIGHFKIATFSDLLLYISNFSIMGTGELPELGSLLHKRCRKINAFSWPLMGVL